MPIFTVGFGSQVRPRDLAIVKVEAPDAVFYQDRVRGQIMLKDDMPAGQPFTVTVKDGDKVVWEQNVHQRGQQLRRIAVRFPGQGTRRAPHRGGQDRRRGNFRRPDRSAGRHFRRGRRHASSRTTTAGLRLRAVTQRRKILLIDGRPRWESRYLRNLFERDEQWEVNAVDRGRDSRRERVCSRGDKPGAFPDEPALLAQLRPDHFRRSAARALERRRAAVDRDFVAQRGGAIVFIDGARGRLQGIRGHAARAAFPVEWKGPGHARRDHEARAHRARRGLAAFRARADRAQNAELWSTLRRRTGSPMSRRFPARKRWSKPRRRARRCPRLFTAPFGAGKVLYHAFDDSWRWRYEVADLHHVRYWNQVANWIAELPFAVRDKFISLDAGAITYRPGDSADLRVRLRDGEGKPVTQCRVDAVLSRDGKKVATIRLARRRKCRRTFPRQNRRARAGRLRSRRRVGRDRSARLQGAHAVQSGAARDGRTHAAQSQRRPAPPDVRRRAAASICAKRTSTNSPSCSRR